jgi:hypothetical protein
VGGRRVVATVVVPVVVRVGSGGVVSVTVPVSPFVPTVRLSVATTRRPPTNVLRTWPAGRTGYTVVLNSIPTTSGRDAAVREARRALRAGLDDVGVLDSADFSTLHPGYYVVFAGIYSTSAEASDAISAARSAGFNTPYPRQIAR